MKKNLTIVVALFGLLLISFILIKQVSPDTLKSLVWPSSSPPPTPATKPAIPIEQMMKGIKEGREVVSQLENSTEQCRALILESPIKSLSQGEFTGTITGSLSYPSEGFPGGMETCAFNINSKVRYCTSEWLEGKQFAYGRGFSLSVPEGNYYVAYVHSKPPYYNPQFYGQHVEVEYNNGNSFQQALRLNAVKVVRNELVSGVSPDKSSAYILCE